jgi:hypothetical protein
LSRQDLERIQDPARRLRSDKRAHSMIPERKRLARKLGAVIEEAQNSSAAR